MPLSITAVTRLTPLAVLALALVSVVGCDPVDNGVMAHVAPVTQPAFLKVAGSLTGRHAQIACEGCHEGETAPFGPVADNCVGCHDADRPTPNHFADKASCNAECHSVSDTCWTWASSPSCRSWEVGTTDTGPTDTDTDTDTDTGTHTGTTDTYQPPTGNSCATATCHGIDPVRDDAAPNSSSHNAHLRVTSNLWEPAPLLGCPTCHPAGNYDSGVGPEVATHQDGTKSVTLEGIAIGLNPTPLYNPGDKSCSGTYCHGAEMADAPANPAWDAGAGEAACGTCHASPPVKMFDGNVTPVTHPGINNCSMCHTPTGSVDETAIGSPTNHINGIIE